MGLKTILLRTLQPKLPKLPKLPKPESAESPGELPRLALDGPFVSPTQSAMDKEVLVAIGAVQLQTLKRHYRVL